MTMFDNLMQAMQNHGAEMGAYMMSYKDTPKGTYVLVDSLDRMYGGGNITVYRIEDRALFLNDVYAVLDARGDDDHSTLDVHSDEVIEAVWDVLNQRCIEAEFDEF